MRGMMSPVNAGWYDTPSDPTSQVYGADFAAQEEAKRVHRSATFQCVAVALDNLRADEADALAEAMRRFCIFMCPEEVRR